MALRSTRKRKLRRGRPAGLANLVSAARARATRVGRIARPERGRARDRSRSGRRWLPLTTGGLLVGGFAIAGYRAVANRLTARAGGESAGSTTDQVRQTVGASREKVGGAARSMLHRIRREPDQPPAPSDPGGSTPARPSPAGSSAPSKAGDTSKAGATS